MDQHQESDMAGPSFDIHSTEGLPPTSTHSPRRDSESTTYSVPVQRMPSGLYELPIHGNCPTCRHRHRAALVKVRMSRSRIGHVRCEQCRRKWIAFGDPNPNATCTSLLSSMTNEPDPIEMDFRSTLYEMVRSLSAVGSPRLPSVSEQAPVKKTEQVHEENDDETRIQDVPVTRSNRTRQYTSPPSSSRAHGGTPSRPLKETEMTARKARRAGALVHRMKKFKNRFLGSEPFRFGNLFKVTKKSDAKVTDKALGKRPVPTTVETRNESASRTHSEPPHQHEPHKSSNKESQGKHKHAERVETEGGARAKRRFDRDLKELEQMDAEARANWYRHQISEFKTQSTEWHFEHTASPRHHSEPFDPHFANFQDPIPQFPSSSSLSVDSVRFSQATTAGSMIATSGVQLPLSVIFNRPPRPNSLPVGSTFPPRGFRLLEHERAGTRSSVESYTSGGIGPNGLDISNMPTAPTSAPTSNAPSTSLAPLHGSVLEHVPTTVTEDASESVPYVNGHRTPDEQSHDHGGSI
ncbi:hypothetical protein EJ04DRAFT_511607 [Polyplosphaeria fusca]|uniref:Uncharacterized protein n=1 Tax=Polyplosphaeria fusca TaxID=682080 RepID=A0A9P4R2K5_9PLEO|nr:hypothetical protein EJ04DRAFT_511607 [Polyplosphaeria fusca]